jgi:hypothetical protein
MWAERLFAAHVVGAGAMCGYTHWQLNSTKACCRLLLNALHLPFGPRVRQAVETLAGDAHVCNTHTSNSTSCMTRLVTSCFNRPTEGAEVDAHPKYSDETTLFIFPPFWCSADRTLQAPLQSKTLFTRRPAKPTVSVYIVHCGMYHENTPEHPQAAIWFIWLCSCYPRPQMPSSAQPDPWPDRPDPRHLFCP